MRRRLGMDYVSVEMVCPCHFRSARAYERRVTKRSVAARSAANSSRSAVDSGPSCPFRSKCWWRRHWCGGNDSFVTDHRASSLICCRSATTPCQSGLRSSSAGGKLPRMVRNTTHGRGRQAWVVATPPVRILSSPQLLEYNRGSRRPSDSRQSGGYVLPRMEGSQAHFLLLALCDSSEVIQRVSPLIGAKPFHPQFKLSC
jgi:hypothetical protein